MMSEYAGNMAMGGSGGQGINQDYIDIGSAGELGAGGYEQTEYANNDELKKKLKTKGGNGGDAGSMGGAAASGFAMGGPYGAAAMVALQAFSASKKAKHQDKVNAYEAQMDKSNRMSKALDGLIATTRGLRL